MNLQELRELIRDYTQGCSHEDVNKSLSEKKVSKEQLLELLCHQDPVRSMAMHGMNKIFTPAKENVDTKFQLNTFEKGLIIFSVIQILGWVAADLRMNYILEHLGFIAFLLGTKALFVYLDKRAEQFAELTEKNKPKVEYIALREGKKVKVEEGEIVVGDLVYLKAGIRIPVDGLMVTGNSLTVNETAVSGDPQNITKKPLGKSRDNTACPILLSHTNVINGCGWMVAVSIGEKTSGYARQCVDAHQNFREDLYESMSRTRIEFLYIGYSKVFRNILIMTSVLVPFLCAVYLFTTGGEHSIILQISRYFMYGATIVYFSQQFLVEKAYDKYFKYCCFDLSAIGIYLNKPDCFEEVQKIKTLVLNRSGILTTNEYILQKLWLGNEIAEFEQNFEDLEITKPLQADEATVEILTRALLGNIDEVMPNKIDRAFVRFLISIVGITDEELPGQIASNYDPSNFRVYANSDNKRMMTLIDKVSGDKRLLIKGAFEDLYRQCTYFIDDEGNQKKIDNDTRERITNELNAAQSECMIPI